jgi:hypothetical protein
VSQKTYDTGGVHLEPETPADPVSMLETAASEYVSCHGRMVKAASIRLSS